MRMLLNYCLITVALGLSLSSRGEMPKAIARLRRICSS
jgi:hypothetical protein